MNKKDRVNCVLSKNIPDRPPILAYQHVPGKERKPEELAHSMLELQKKFDWDILKIHPAATVMNEVWGDKFDYTKYNDIFPTQISKGISSVDELENFVFKDPGHGPMADMIEAVKLVKKGLTEDMYVLQTLFTPINYVCKALSVPTVRRHFPADRKDSVLFSLFKEKPDLIKKALEGITSTFEAYVGETMRAGADGFFFAEIGWAREGYMLHDEWSEFIKPYDLRIIDAIHKNGGIVMFHTCGMKSNVKWFSDEYPLDILHWDQGGENNPPLEQSDEWLGEIIPMGGVNEMLFGNHKEKEIREATIKTLKANKDLAYILAPYCSISPQRSDEELRAFRFAIDEVYPLS